MEEVEVLSPSSLQPQSQEVQEEHQIRQVLFRQLLLPPSYLEEVEVEELVYQQQEGQGPQMEEVLVEIQQMGAEEELLPMEMEETELQLLEVQDSFLVEVEQEVETRVLQEETELPVSLK